MKLNSHCLNCRQVVPRYTWEGDRVDFCSRECQEDYCEGELAPITRAAPGCVRDLPDGADGRPRSLGEAS